MVTDIFNVSDRKRILYAVVVYRRLGIIVETASVSRGEFLIDLRIP